MPRIPSLIYGCTKSFLKQTTCALRGALGKFSVKKRQTSASSPLNQAKANGNLNLATQKTPKDIQVGIQSSLKIIESVKSGSERISEKDTPSKREVKKFLKSCKANKEALKEQLGLIKNQIETHYPHSEQHPKLTSQLDKAIQNLNSVTKITQFNFILTQIEISLKETIEPGLRELGQN